MSPDWDEITAMQLTNKDDRIAELSAEIRKLRALLRECLPALSGHLRDMVMQQLGSG